MSDNIINKASRQWWLDNYSKYEDQPDRDQDIAGLDGFEAGADWVLRDLEEYIQQTRNSTTREREKVKK